MLSRDPRYRFHIMTSGSGPRVRLEDGLDVMDPALEWAFGTGRQAVTFVTRVNRKWYLEHYATLSSDLVFKTRLPSLETPIAQPTGWIRNQRPGANASTECIRVK